MIIQIAGTNGAGKSTIVRTLLEQYTTRELSEAGRCRGYYLTIPDVARQVFVVGSYAAPTGGCDTLKTLDEVYALVCRAVGACKHVLFEGASHTMNQTRGPKLVPALGEPFVVVLLTTPLGVCLDGIDARRRERGAGVLADSVHVQGSHTRAQNYAARMRDAGARIVRASREEAPARVLELLRGR